MAATRFSLAAAALCLAGCTINDTRVVQMQTNAAIGAVPAVAPRQVVLRQNILPVKHQRVASGRRIDLGFMTSVGADCQSLGAPTATLLREPQHGTFVALPGDGHPSFTPDNPRSACNASSVAGTYLRYRSEPYFVGTDPFLLLLRYPDGNQLQWGFVMDVMPPTPLPRPMPSLGR